MSFSAAAAVFFFDRAHHLLRPSPATNTTPDPKQIALAEELLVRLETDGVAVRLNLLGQPGEQPDFVVAGWVLPYVYALSGDRDWRRNPQLTGSRQVSQLAVQAYKLLETGDATIPELNAALGPGSDRRRCSARHHRALAAVAHHSGCLGPRPDRQMATAPHAFPESHCRRRIDLAGDGDLGACLHLSAGRDRGQHGRGGAFPGSAYRTQQGSRSASRAGSHPPGAYHLSGPRAAFLRCRHASGVLLNLPLPIPALRCWPQLVSCAHGTIEKDEFEFEARTLAPPASTASIKPRPEAESHTSDPLWCACLLPARSPLRRDPTSAGRPRHSRDRKPAQSSNGSHPARRTSPESRTSGARRPVTGTRPAPAGTRWARMRPQAPSGTEHTPPARRVDCGRKAALSSVQRLLRRTSHKVFHSGMGTA